jgi:hypothetical protein
MDVVLETTSETEGTLTWYGKYSTVSEPFVIPITIDASTESFQIANWQELDQTYTNGDEEYKLSVMVMMTDGSKIYRVKPASLPYMTATLVEDERGVLFDMSAEYGSYSFYALRIGYGTGGYDGYVGSFTTYPYCYLMKQ